MKLEYEPKTDTTRRRITLFQLLLIVAILAVVVGILWPAHSAIHHIPLKVRQLPAASQPATNNPQHRTDY